RADGDARGRLAGRGAFQDVAGIGPSILEQPDQVGVAGARQEDPAQELLLDVRARRLVRHRLLPMLPVPVPDQHRNGRTERLAEADAGKELGVVLLDLHPCAPAVAALAAPELGVDIALHGERQPCGHTLDQGDESAAVRLARGLKSEMHDSLYIMYGKSPAEAGLSVTGLSPIYV